MDSCPLTRMSYDFSADQCFLRLLIDSGKAVSLHTLSVEGAFCHHRNSAVICVPNKKCMYINNRGKGETKSKSTDIVTKCNRDAMSVMDHGFGAQ